MRFFNTAGPIQPQHHYHIPPLERLDLDGVRMLIREQNEVWGVQELLSNKRRKYEYERYIL